MPLTQTTETFIAKAREVHGDLYDYSKTIYVKSSQDVSIGCKKHGLFVQRAAHHVQGSGCRACGTKTAGQKRVRASADSFEERARKIHGDRYNYDRVVLVAVREKVTIFCNGCQQPFEQTPDSHLKGSGCESCVKKAAGLARRLGQDDFLRRSREVHGERYDYTAVAYNGVDERVTIVCRVPGHGSFEQIAMNHMSGAGCSKCGYERHAAASTYTTEEFVARAKEAHGNAFDYSETVYLGGHSPVTIRCRIEGHGYFTTLAADHMSGAIRGCKVCKAIGISVRSAKPVEQLLAEFQRIHGNRYIYERLDYKGDAVLVTITCRLHGDFEQTPRVHLMGSGCQVCAKRGFSRACLDWLAFEQIGRQGPIKHALSGGEHRIGSYRVDGFCATTQTVWEFMGCFWHGCIKCFPDRSEINVVKKQSMEVMYNRTIARILWLREQGYEVRVVWEHSWRVLLRVIRPAQRRARSKHAQSHQAAIAE
jgi:hypothetical protein